MSSSQFSPALPSEKQKQSPTTKEEKSFFLPHYFSDCIPPQVLHEHLKPNGQLMDDWVIAVIESKAKELDPGKKLLADKCCYGLNSKILDVCLQR